jgi:hypothetical protein
VSTPIQQKQKKQKKKKHLQRHRRWHSRTSILTRLCFCFCVDGTCLPCPPFQSIIQWKQTPFYLPPFCQPNTQSWLLEEEDVDRHDHAPDPDPLRLALPDARRLPTKAQQALVPVDAARVGAWGVVEDGFAEAPQKGAGDDEEEDDGDEARKVKDGRLDRLDRFGCGCGCGDEGWRGEQRWGGARYALRRQTYRHSGTQTRTMVVTRRGIGLGVLDRGGSRPFRFPERFLAATSAWPSCGVVV